MATALEFSDFEHRDKPIDEKVTFLEKKVKGLEDEFSTMIISASQLAKVVKKYVDKVETERQVCVARFCLLIRSTLWHDILNKMSVC